MQRAYSYIRFSKASQALGDSYDRQLQGTREYCQKNNMVLDESLDLKDLGVSSFKGRNITHGALGRFLDACEEGLVPAGSALVIEALDRLSRQSPRKTISLLNRILDYQVELHLTTSRKIFRPDAGPEEGMDLIIAVSMAIESNRSSADRALRIQHAWAELRRRAKEEGHVMRADVPWWLVIENGKIVSPDERAAVVKEIYELTASGLSSLQIARQLNKTRRPTWRPQKLWNSARVRDVVRVRRAEGVLTGTAKTAHAGRDYEIPDYYPRIVSAELAAQARAVMARNTRGSRGRSPEGKRPVNIFRGLLRFRKVWLRHAVHQNGKPDPETGKKGFNAYYDAIDELRRTNRVLYTTPARQLETIIATALVELRPEDLEPKRQNPEAAKLEHLRGQLADVIQREKNLLAAVESGSTSVAARLTEVEAERRKKESEVARTELLATKPAKMDTKGLRPLVENLHDPAARELAAASLRRLVTRIDVCEEFGDLLLPDSARMKFIKAAAKAKPISDPTPRRMRRNIWALIHFASGAKRLIWRPVEEEETDLRKVTRILTAGLSPADERPTRKPPPTFIFSVRIEPDDVGDQPDTKAPDRGTSRSH